MKKTPTLNEQKTSTVFYCLACELYQPTTYLQIDTDARFQFTLECGHSYAMELKVINNGVQVQENFKKEKIKEKTVVDEPQPNALSE